MSRITIPNWATYPKVPAGAAVAAALATYNSAMGTSVAAGDANPIWDWLISHVIRGNVVNQRNRNPTGLAVVDTDSELEDYTSLADIRRLVAAGGDLHNYPVFLQFPQAALSSNVPLAWPNSQYAPDPEDPGTLVRRTVSEYFDGTQYPMTWPALGTDHVVPNQDFRSSGMYLPASLWVNLAGVTIRSVEWFVTNQGT